MQARKSLMGAMLVMAPALAGAMPAAAYDGLPQRRAPHHPVPAGEADGCYWQRGRQYCGRFCYWEINGRRYCQRREERAVPQGVHIEDYILDEGASPAQRRPYWPRDHGSRRRTW